MNLKNFTVTTLTALMFSIGFSACATDDDDGDTGNSSAAGNSSSSNATGSSSSAYDSDKGSGIFDISIDGATWSVDSSFALAPIDLGDTGVLSIASNIMQAGAYQHTSFSEPDELYLYVQDPVVGVNDSLGLTLFQKYYGPASDGSDSSAVWLIGDSSTVTITSFSSTGAEGALDLRMEKMCFWDCGADSVIHVTGSFSLTFAQY